MENSRTWQEFRDTISSWPDMAKNLEFFLEINGYFDPQFESLQQVQQSPQEIFDLTERLRWSAVQSFSSEAIEVLAANSPLEEDPERNGVIYTSALVFNYRCSKSGVIGYLQMDAGIYDTQYNPKGAVQFTTKLPVDAIYLQESRQFLEAIWPQVRGIKFAFPENARSDTPKNILGDILLKSCGKYIATGYKAFETAGLSLPNKQFLTAGHHYPS